MKNLSTKAKLFIFAAIAIIALLLAVNIALIISNRVVQNKLDKQEKQLEELKDKVSSAANISYHFGNIEVSL